MGGRGRRRGGGFGEGAFSHAGNESLSLWYSGGSVRIKFV